MAIWREFELAFHSYQLNYTFINAHLAMYFIWRMDTTAKGAKKNTSPNVIHLQYTERKKSENYWKATEWWLNGTERSLNGHWNVTAIQSTEWRLKGDWMVTEWHLSVFTEWWRFVLWIKSSSTLTVFKQLLNFTLIYLPDFT